MSDPKLTLHQLLSSLGESSRFVASGSLPPVLPGLEVAGVGSIGTPVSAADAKRLLARAAPAPYGRGEETILDPSVRRVWQFEPDQFALRNPDWNAHIAAIVEAVKQEFGIGQKVQTQLYKLLVYKKGSFFAPHRDTEKTPGMFATLVVGLPSKHEGGTLIVEHDGQSRTIDFGGPDAEFRSHYAAFYADCRHEITPVTSGYRVCLVYNLAVAGKKSQPAAPQSTAVVEKAAQLFAELFADPTGKRDKVAIPFVHQYTEAGLDPMHLKGVDRSRADVLVRAAERLGYQCYFALLTHHQSGEADYDTLDFDPFRRRSADRWSYDDEDDEEFEDEGDDSEAEMGEVYDEDRTLDHWLDPQGHKQPFGTIHLDEDEILNPEGRAGWSFRQEVHEATGNEGVSLERWYRQGVLVIWPRDHTFSILAGEGQASALPALEQMAVGSKRSSVREECRTFAAKIVASWQPRQRYGAASDCTGRMLKLLGRIGDAELAERFLRDVFPKDFEGSEGKALLRLFAQFGWEPFGPALRAFLDQQTPENSFTQLGRVLAIVEPLCCDEPSLADDRRVVCVSLTAPLARLIERWDRVSPPPYGYRQANPRLGVVASAVRIFAATASRDELDGFVSHAITDSRHYDLREVLIPDVKTIARWVATVPAARPAFTRFLEHCLTELRSATARPIEPPADWTREADLKCKCEDCRALARFLRDPEQRVGRFPLRKDRRQHLHRQIDQHQCDCTHVTERVGSPQTLVCTKTQASYERRQKQWEADRKHLAELEAIAPREHLALAQRTTGRRASKK